MMRALPFEHCVKFMSEHISEEVRDLTTKTHVTLICHCDARGCDAHLHPPVLYMQSSKPDSSLTVYLY